MKDHLIFDTTDATSIKDSDKVGAYMMDAAGKLITSQTQASQQVLDVGINVGGAQIDPRQIRALASGTDSVSVVQSTSPWVTKDQSDGPVAPGTAASFSQLGGGVFNTAAPTLTNGQQAAFQMDNAGRLLVDIGNSINLAVDLNGIYNVSTNATPDNVGIIGSSRAAPGLANQTLQFTGAAPSSDALASTNIVAQDVNSFGMSWNVSGTHWDRMTNDGAGNLNVNVQSMPSLTVNDAALANTAIVAKTLTLSVAGTAQAAVSSPLASRKYLWLYNFSNKQIFVGGAGVTAAAGFPVSPGSYMEMRAGASSPVNFIGQTGQTPEIRTLEAS
jgi:hypothetical protein